MRTLLLTALLVLPAPAHHHPEPKAFDVQAHRGGLGLRVENTLASFGNALQLGASTLELDVQITADGAAVVTHDRRVTAAKCTGDRGRRHDPPRDHPVLRLAHHHVAIPDLKLKVIPYTVDHDAIMERLIGLGVDGIITDDPDLLVSVAIRHGLR